MQKFLADLALLTLREPREAAARILAMDLPRQTLWLGFALAVSASAVLAWLTLASVPVPESAVFRSGYISPVTIALMQTGSLLALVVGMSYGGRIFGGKGGFLGALALAVWLELILIVLQLAQLIIVLTIPALSTPLGFAGMALFLWVLTNFVAALHGFSHLGKVFGGIMLGFVLVGVVLALFIGTPTAGGA